MKVGVPKIPPKKFEYRSFKNYNKSEFIKDLNQVPWSVVNGVENVDVAVFLWEKLLSEIVNEHAPLKIQQAKESKKYEIVCSKTYFKWTTIVANTLFPLFPEIYWVWSKVCVE